jgi:cytochrome c-type biogenesis protein CcmH/NrfG
MSEHPPLPPLPPGLQNALGAVRRELTPKDADRDRVWQSVKAGVAGTGEPVELAARVRSLDEAREAKAAKTGSRVYAAATTFAVAAGLLAYVATRALSGSGSGSGSPGTGNNASATRPLAESSLTDAGTDAAVKP